MNVAQPTSAATAPRVSPGWLVRLRRLVAVPVAVALILGAPGLAYATFTAKTGGSLAVGTYSIPAPASATGNRTCNNGNSKGITINITSFAAVSKATEETQGRAQMKSKTVRRNKCNTRKPTVRNDGGEGVAQL